MAAFDLNAFYAIQKPKTSSFEEINDQFGAGFDLGRRVREQQDRNSVKALIAQRESEGVPYDTLSNEVAKYDPNLANAMRDERRTSIGFNYKQGVAEFEQWRKNIARRIAGRVLQKADEMGLPQENLDQYLDLAAKYVITYDPELAEWLLRQGATRRYNHDRTNRPTGKPIVDGENKIRDIINMANKATGDGLSDPEAMRNRAKDKEAGDRLMAWKNADPYDFYTNPNGRLIYPRMISVIRSASKDNPMSLTDEEVTRLVQNVGPDLHDSVTEPVTETRTGPSAPAPSPAPKAAAPKAPVSASNVKDYGLKPIFTTDRWTKAKVSDSKAIGALSDFIDALDPTDDNFLDKAKTAKRILREGTVIKDNDLKSQTLTPMQQEIERKEAEYKAMKDEVGESSMARLFWKNLPTRSRGAEAKRFRQAGTFASGIFSNAPFTIIDNGLMVQSPDYQITEAMQKQAKMLKTPDEVTNFISAYSNSGNGLLENLAKQNTAFDVIAALGDAVLMTMRPLYLSMIEGKSAEEVEGIDKFLKQSYGWPDKLFKALKDPDGSLGTAKDIEERSRHIGNKKKNVYFEDNERLPGEKGGVGGSSSVDALFEGL